ncbi:UNVERIFIED_CONTAM: hypothetical protein GTU68_053015, partial [Idotea baltica]|nr:hypothetical protein [Idotea baltica]
SSGPDVYDRLRPLIYVDTDVFLACFSVVCPFSIERVKEKWISEITRFKKSTPFLLVGTKTDLREDTATLEKLAKHKRKPFSYEQGEKLSQKVKAVKYVECSALTQKGVKNVFDEAILAALEPSAESKKRKMCLLL